MMSQQQFNNLTSNLLKEKHAFTSLVAKKERKKERKRMLELQKVWVPGLKLQELNRRRKREDSPPKQV